MKIILIGLLQLLLATSAYSQVDDLNFLDDVHDIDVDEIVYDNSTTVGDDITGDVTGASSVICKKEDQKSIPLAYLSKLLKPTKEEIAIIAETKKPVKKDLKIRHNPGSGKLTIDRTMVSNCKDMIKWEVVEPKGTNSNFYLKASIKSDPTKCTADKCTYEILQPDLTVKPVEYTSNFDGFKKCIADAELSKKVDGKHVNVVYRDIDISINVKNTTGNLYFLSEGPMAQEYGPLHKKIVNSKCQYVERVNKSGLKLFSQKDSDYNKKLLKLNLLCSSSNYKDVIANMDKFYEFESQLLNVTRNLIMKEAKAVAKIINEVDSQDEMDEIKVERLEIFADYQKYIIKPILSKINKQFLIYKNLGKGALKTAAKKELDKLKDELKKYTKAPFPSSGQKEKLELYGKFEPAKNLNLTLITVSKYKDVGKKIDGEPYSPKEANEKIITVYQDYVDDQETKEVEYEIKTCERSGEAKKYVRRLENMNVKLMAYAKYYAGLEKKLVKKGNRRCGVKFSSASKKNCYDQYRKAVKDVREDRDEVIQKIRDKAKDIKEDGKRIARLEKKVKKRCAASDDDEDDDDDDDDDIKPKKFSFDWIDDDYEDDIDDVDLVGNDRTNNNNTGHNFNWQANGNNTNTQNNNNNQSSFWDSNGQQNNDWGNRNTWNNTSGLNFGNNFGNQGTGNNNYNYGNLNYNTGVNFNNNWSNNNNQWAMNQGNNWNVNNNQFDQNPGYWNNANNVQSNFGNNGWNNNNSNGTGNLPNFGWQG